MTGNLLVFLGAALASAVVVGVVLTSFGTFWAGEGVGLDWPGSDAALVALVVLTAAWSWGFIRLLARGPHAVPA